MSSPDVVVPPTDQPPRRRFSFGLKEVFVIITLLCIWLGVKVTRERRADEMLLRRQAVYNTLLKSMHKPPFDTHIEFAPGLLRNAISVRDKDWILSTGASRDYETEELELTLGPTIATMPGEKIVREIADHVGLGLNECGLYSEGGLTQSIGPAWRYIGSWQQDETHEFTVLIEVVAEPVQSKSAMVWVAVVENQSLLKWHFRGFGAPESIAVIFLLTIGWLVYRRRSMQS